MCVSLLERVKQGKSNIILILILSARSQDRDRKELDRTGIDEKFQSTRSQDRDRKTKQLLIILSPFLYTFHT